MLKFALHHLPVYICKIFLEKRPVTNVVSTTLSEVFIGYSGSNHSAFYLYKANIADFYSTPFHAHV